jgi:hypothetical protein
VLVMLLRKTHSRYSSADSRDSFLHGISGSTTHSFYPSTRTYFTQLCSTFLNKLTEIIAPEMRKWKSFFLPFPIHHHRPGMFIKKHDKSTEFGALRVCEAAEEGFEATSALKYAFEKLSSSLRSVGTRLLQQTREKF